MSKKKRRKPKSKLKQQISRANARAMYGASGKPAPVTVRRIEDGKVLAVEPQGVFDSRRRKGVDPPERMDWIAERFAHLGYKSYGGYLRSAHWRAVKERWVALGRSTRCYVCGKDECQLHHRTYRRLGCEELDDLVPLCRFHHNFVHRLVKKGAPLFTAHERALAMEAQTDAEIDAAFEDAA